MKAIVWARFAIENNPTNLEFMMSRWSTKTQTFVTAWGEFSLSLEDVAILMSMPFLSEAHASGVVLKEKSRRRSTT